MLDYYPTWSGLSTGTGGENDGSNSYWSLFMPKWQQDDYYSDNFRINKGDAVAMLYKDTATVNAATDPTTTFSTSASIQIENGAIALSTAAGLAFAAAALTF